METSLFLCFTGYAPQGVPRPLNLHRSHAFVLPSRPPGVYTVPELRSLLKLPQS
jgi:hypothetical protein